jgi:hypothetical protein
MTSLGKGSSLPGSGANLITMNTATFVPAHWWRPYPVDSPKKLFQHKRIRIGMYRCTPIVRADCTNRHHRNRTLHYYRESLIGFFGMRSLQRAAKEKMK